MESSNTHDRFLFTSDEIFNYTNLHVLKNDINQLLLHTHAYRRTHTHTDVRTLTHSYTYTHKHKHTENSMAHGNPPVHARPKRITCPEHVTRVIKPRGKLSREQFRATATVGTPDVTLADEAGAALQHRM